MISSFEKHSKAHTGLSTAFNGQWNNASVPCSLLTKAAFKITQNDRFKDFMEDNCKIINNFMDSPNHSYYAVFDGHAGSFAADWCFEHLHKSIAQNLKLFSPSWDFPEIMASAFELADKQMISAAIKADDENNKMINNKTDTNNNNPKLSSPRKSNNVISGCTVSVVMITSNPHAFSNNVNHNNTNNLNPSIGNKFVYIKPQKKTRRSFSSSVSQTSPSPQNLTDHSPLTTSSPHPDISKDTQTSNTTNDGSNLSLSPYTRYLYTCNVGDSSIVLCIKGEAKPLSYNHRATDKSERLRISSSQSDAFVAKGRVNGILSVSRAIGDSRLKPEVSPRPYTSVTPIDNSAHEFVIIASDGLWDVSSPQESVNLVRYIEDPEEASAALVRYALKQGSNDNITCMVIRLNPPPPSPPAPSATNGSTILSRSDQNLLVTRKKKSKTEEIDMGKSIIAQYGSQQTAQLSQKHDIKKSTDTTTVFKDTINITLLPTSSISENALSAPQQVRMSNSTSSPAGSRNGPLSPPPSFNGISNTTSISQSSTSSILDHFVHTPSIVSSSSNRCALPMGTYFPRNLTPVSPSNSDMIMGISEDDDDSPINTNPIVHRGRENLGNKAGDDSEGLASSSAEDYDEAITSEEDGVFKTDDLGNLPSTIDVRPSSSSSTSSSSTSSSSSSSNRWMSPSSCSPQTTHSPSLHQAIWSPKNNEFHVRKTSPPLMKRPHHRAASFSPSFSSESARRSLRVFQTTISNNSSSSNSTPRYITTDGSSSLLENSIVEESFAESHSGPNQRTTLDRYGRVKRNVILDYDTSGDFECAIADDEDDEDDVF